jgi:membrane-bound serine protease (ClpP class)
LQGGDPVRGSLLLVIILVLASWLAYPIAVYAAKPTSGKVVVARVEGVISGAMADYVISAIRFAEREDAVLVLVMDTPGGFVDAALEIVKAIKESRVPVVGYVVGRWAVSAGTMILMCTHLAAMQPGTIIGAVQPVAFNPATGGYTPINESKILNPLYKEIEACMKLRGRNVTLAKQFVYHNLVLDADEAVKEGAIELVAVSVDELLRKINGTLVETQYGAVELVTWPAERVEYEMGIGLRIAQFLSDPIISGLLSTIGIFIILAALFSGHPHLIAVGVALILMSLLGMGYSASLLAIVMLVTGVVLLIVELTLIPGFGAVGAAGVGLIVLGLLMLPAGGGQVTISPTYMQTVTTIVLSAAAPLAGFLGLVVYKVVRTWKARQIYTPTVVGKTGRALDDIPAGGEGFVIVEGEYWRAKASKPVRRDCRVKVIGKEGPVLIVEPLEECS